MIAVEIFLVGVTLGLGAWLGLHEPGWLIKIATAVCVYLTWDFFQSLLALNRDMKHLTRDLNDVLHRQIKAISWKALIHKLSLVLGYKQITGVEVFRMDGDLAYGDRHHTRH